MSDLIAAADALVPFLATGAGAVAAGTAEEAGAELYKSATSVIGKIRHRLRGTGRAEVEAALSDALDDGTLSTEDLRSLRAAFDASQGTTNITVGDVKAENSFIGKNITIDRFMS